MAPPHVFPLHPQCAADIFQHVPRGKSAFSLRNLQYRNRQCLKRTSKKSFLLCQLLLSYLLSLLPKGRGRLPISALFLLHSRQESRKGERPISDGHAPPPPPLPACNSNRPIPASLLLLPFLLFGGEVAGPYLSRTILHFHLPRPPQRSRQGKVASRLRSPPVPERGAYVHFSAAGSGQCTLHSFRTRDFLRRRRRAPKWKRA